MEQEDSVENSNWLNAYYDPIAALYSFSSCVALADLNGDGDNKLLIANLGNGAFNMKLKVTYSSEIPVSILYNSVDVNLSYALYIILCSHQVYKGTSVIQENSLLDLPMGICTFYMDTNEPRTAGVAVASGPYLYVYKNMKPYYKFTLPLLTVNPLEGDIWNKARDEKVDVSALWEVLSDIRVNTWCETNHESFLSAECNMFYLSS